MKKISFREYTTFFVGFIFSLLLAILSFFFMPKIIAIQWDGLTPVKWGSRNYIFLLPIISLFVILLYPFLNNIGSKRFVDCRFTSYGIFSLLIIVLSCEIYTILYAFYPQIKISISSILITELVVQIILYLLFILSRKRK